MAKELITIDTLPVIPLNWDYQRSVELTKTTILKWRNLTTELATELWIARKALALYASNQPRSTVGSFIPTGKNWTIYCQEIGSSRQVVNSWLKRFFPDGSEEELLTEANEPLPSNIKLLEGDVIQQLATIPDETVDLLLTDPPYGVMTDYQWDAKDLIFLDGWLKAVQPKLKPIYNGFIFCDARMQYEYETIIQGYFKIKNRIIWVRKNMAKGRVVKDRFISSYEVIFFVGNRELNLPKEWGAERFDSCEFAVPQSNFKEGKVHPTQKPLELFKRLVSVGSFPGDTILDCFAGSGTTGIACELMDNLTCILIENDQKYIKIIKERFNELGR